MTYLRKTSNYLERVPLFDTTHMMSMTNPMAIGVKTPRIDSGYSLDKQFSSMN